MEERNAHLLLTPSAKKRSWFTREYPFPIVPEECKKNKADPQWEIAEGYLEHNCVLVHDEQSMKRLYCMGFFGKGTLSKSGPKICYPKRNPRPAISSAIDDIVDVVDSDNSNSKKLEMSNEDESSNSKKLDTSNEDESSNSKKLEKSHKDEGHSKKIEEDNKDEILISDSSDSDNDEKRRVSDEKESLQLTFQEAYFLSYGLGCLIVKEKDKLLNLQTLWTRFCMQSKPGNFPVMYTAYHHFRSKGWVVKSGLKYGADYVLYKDGPPYYHATYCVIVRSLKEDLTDDKGNRELTWGTLAALNRVSTTAGKGLLILYVIKPSSMTESTLCTPLCIPQFKLEEVLYKRWVASENRE